MGTLQGPSFGVAFGAGWPNTELAPDLSILAFATFSHTLADAVSCLFTQLDDKRQLDPMVLHLHS